jgi:hypothetical protein
MRRREQANERLATSVAPRFARFVGAPVAHAAHCGDFRSRTPGMPMEYRGHFEGGASISDANGQLLAFRDRRDGAGFVVADVEPGRVEPVDDVPDRFWLHRRDLIAAVAWNVQRLHGRRWYARNAAARPPLEIERREATRV